MGTVCASESAAKAMAAKCCLCLDECRAYGLKEVLITCNKENLASAATIRKVGGILENEVPHGGTLVQRYWVKLDEK